MRCPVCAHDETQIVARRESDESDVIRRCLKCEKRFTTGPSIIYRSIVAKQCLVHIEGAIEPVGLEYVTDPVIEALDQPDG